ncbi:hypothetical protein Hanom_Chr02g00173961 [Helianthus anomalus]
MSIYLSTFRSPPKQLLIPIRHRPTSNLLQKTPLTSSDTDNRATTILYRTLISTSCGGYVQLDLIQTIWWWLCTRSSPPAPPPNHPPAKRRSLQPSVLVHFISTYRY